MKFKHNVIRVLPAFLLEEIQRIKLRRVKSYPILNINLNPALKCQKRVLISYVTDSLTRNLSEWDVNSRSQESAVIVSTFIKLGYSVDVISANDLSSLNRLHHDYDVIFGFGEVFFEMCKKHPNARRILYLTERHPIFSFQKEKERIEYFYERHKRKIAFGRSGLYYQDAHFKHVNAVIYVGNERDREHIPVSVPCFPIKITGLENRKFKISEQHVSTSRKNFLWLGSKGAVHKGLDLLIDVFEAQNESVLHIAGLNTIDRRRLQNYRNSGQIVDHGFLPIQSDEFAAVMQACGYILFPSCSEGMSTSVITAMNHGLIPIITPETGIELEHVGHYISDFSVASIAGIVREYARKPIEWVLAEKLRVMGYSKSTFTISNFETRFREILSMNHL